MCEWPTLVPVEPSDAANLSVVRTGTMDSDVGVPEWALEVIPATMFGPGLPVSTSRMGPA
jgi:hypothetical protein